METNDLQPYYENVKNVHYLQLIHLIIHLNVINKGREENPRNDV